MGVHQSADVYSQPGKNKDPVFSHLQRPFSTEWKIPLRSVTVLAPCRHRVSLSEIFLSTLNRSLKGLSCGICHTNCETRNKNIHINVLMTLSYEFTYTYIIHCGAMISFAEYEGDHTTPSLSKTRTLRRLLNDNEPCVSSLGTGPVRDLEPSIDTCAGT